MIPKNMVCKALPRIAWCQPSLNSTVSTITRSGRLYSTETPSDIKVDFLGFMNSVHKVPKDVENVQSILDPMPDGSQPNQQIQKQRIDRLVDSRSMHHLLALPFVEDSQALSQRWKRSKSWNHFPVAHVMSIELQQSLPTDFVTDYTRLIGYQVARANILGRFSRGLSLPVFMNRRGIHDARLGAFVTEQLYLKHLARLYNINPRPEILEFVQRTSPMIYDVLEILKLYPECLKQLAEIETAVQNDFGSLEQIDMNPWVFNFGDAFASMRKQQDESTAEVGKESIEGASSEDKSKEAL